MTAQAPGQDGGGTRAAPTPHRECPVCGGHASRVLHRQRFMEGVLGDGYDVVVCAACGAGFADGVAAQPELDAHYATLSKYTYGGSGGRESVYDFKRFELTLGQVEPHLGSREASVLDVGCATGGLLSVFKTRGYKNVTGADPSPECSRIAGELHGVDVRVATLAQLPGWRERYDLIVMVGVLEHVRDAKAAARNAAGLLSENGRFYVAVPDVEGLPTLRNAPFQEFSMEHVNFFSRVSLDNLLGSVGLHPVESWQTVVEWSEGTTEPILAALYARGQPGPLTVDTLTESALARYVENSRAADAVFGAAVDVLVREQRPLLVWGAGALTRRLLASTRLGSANIAAFVDSSPSLQGRDLAGRRILAPSQLAGRSEDILICSVAFGREIEIQIRERLRLTNAIVKLG